MNRFVSEKEGRCLGLSRSAIRSGSRRSAQTVFVDCGYSGMVLREEGEYERSWSGREGVDSVKGERIQDQGDDDGRKEKGRRENGEKK